MTDITNPEQQNTVDTGIALMQFPKQVLSRLQPDLVLQRHLQLGLRPKTLMKFEEFRNVEENSSDDIFVNKTSNSDLQMTKDEDSSDDALILANNVLKVGNMFIKTELSLGIAEFDSLNINEDSFAPIWPEVNIDRGRIGAPTDEEMIVSRQIFENIICGKYIKQKDLVIKSIGKKTEESETVTYNSLSEEDELLLENENKWSFVLYAKINVYSREGPVYDHVFNSLMLCLKKLKFPGVYIEESSIDLQIPSKKSFNRKQKQETQRTFKMKFDFQNCKKLILNKNISISSNFGVIYKDPTLALSSSGGSESVLEDAMDVENESKEFKREPILIADISTDIEESSIFSRLSVSCNSSSYTSINLMNGSNNQKISVQQLKDALQLSKARFNSLNPN
ncbi:hypothetical protein QEN19_002870 [Hanseniaspora menglaensis]